MKRETRWALWLLLLLQALGRSCGQLQSTGLFPPVEFRSSFSSFRFVSATSTCAPCTQPGCTTCNRTCPYGEESPQPVNVLEEGEVASGVVRTVGQFINCMQVVIIILNRVFYAYCFKREGM